MSIALLKKYDRLYANGLSPISDLEYDNLKEKLSKLFPNDPYFKTVGSPIDSREKVKLPYIMGSLKKLKIDDGSCKKWLLEHKNKEVIITPKMDGVSVIANFLNGKLKNAYLRGDGQYGRNITNKCKKFIKPIKNKSDIWVRGEILLDYLPDDYVNKRNAAAGIINDDDHYLLLDLKVVFYEYINSELETELHRMDELFSFGLPLVFYKKSKINELTDDILKDVLFEYKERYPMYDIDGLVLTLNESIRENVAYPEKKIAFKVNQDAIETVVKKVEWNTSRTGKVVPIVCIEPVTINGVVVSKATGFNAKFIKENTIIPGKKIGIVRSGDVIPYLVIL